jgi:hemoglobin
MNKYAIRKSVCLALAAFCLIPLMTALGCSNQKASAPPAATTPTLYERLGGVNNIAPLIDDVIERSYRDEVFEANPRIAAAHKRFPKAVYKYNATALACQVMGGPQKYTGRSLKEAHQHLQITEEEWHRLIRIFRDSMNSYKVPMQEQSEIIGILESTKGEVVASAAN